jgi:hypothetical protein
MRGHHRVAGATAMSTAEVEWKPMRPPLRATTPAD